MKYQRAIFLVALIVICFGACSGQQVETAQTVDNARLNALREAGFEALYNLDYEKARRQFKEIVQLFPDHPAGPQFLAAALWTQTLNESRRLQASLYNSDSFYSETKEKTDPRTGAQFRELTRQATALAKARLKRNPRDAEALYFLGATEGLKAAFSTAVERSFIGALRDGSSSVDRHREVIKLDPNFHDAELTIGLYDYVVGTLPLPVKLLASLTGARGSKKRGLQTLERVAQAGRWARDDARALLIVLYKREQRFADAITISRELAAKYPHNYLFQIETADALVSQSVVERQSNNAATAAAREREAFAIFDSLLRERANMRDAAARALDLIHFCYGESLMTAGQWEAAAKEFLASATQPGAEAGLATFARLRAAQALDAAGKRTEAIAQYRAVLARPNIYDSHSEAEQGLRQPYKITSAEKIVSK